VEKTPARKVFEKATERAWVRGHMTGTPHAKRYARHVYLVRFGKADPEDLAEDLLPGREVMRLSPEDREALRGLTADMTQDRQ
jgi:hypothetical protein